MHVKHWFQLSVCMEGKGQVTQVFQDPSCFSLGVKGLTPGEHGSHLDMENHDDPVKEGKCQGSSYHCLPIHDVDKVETHQNSGWWNVAPSALEVTNQMKASLQVLVKGYHFEPSVDEVETSHCSGSVVKVTNRCYLWQNMKASVQVLVKVCHFESSVYEVETYQNLGH